MSSSEPTLPLDPDDLPNWREIQEYFYTLDEEEKDTVRQRLRLAEASLSLVDDSRPIAKVIPLFKDIESDD